MTTLTTAPLAPLLDRLFEEAQQPAPPEVVAAMREIPPEDWQELYTAAGDVHLSVSRETATLLYMLARSTGARSIVEYGSSFGISTLHLAAAVRDGGRGGRVITTEFEPGKARRAQENFRAAGLHDVIELREGDARDTLASDLPQQIDLVLMDGAKGLYPEVLDQLEHRLGPGALVIADDADRSPRYLARVRSPEAGWLSIPFAEDVELSMRLA